MAVKHPPLYRVNTVSHDGPMRMRVPSRTKGQPPYLVQLTSYGCNGTCQCKHFGCRLEPLLKLGISPRQAFEEGRAEIPEWGTVEDALRCFHIHVARLKFADDTIQAISQDTSADETKE